MKLMGLKSGVVGVACAMVVGMPAMAGHVLYGAAHIGPDGPSFLYVIDPLTGEATLVGEIGFERVSGLDAHPITNSLYGTGERSDGSDEHVLITIDPVTGEGTEVGPTGVQGFLGFWAGNTFSDISFRSDGSLFAFSFPGEGVATVSLTSGAGSQVGFSVTGANSPSGNPLGFLASAGSALAFSPSGTLFHAAWIAPHLPGGPPSLHEVDPATSLVTGDIALVFPPDPDVLDTRSPRPNGMDFDPESGVLFASIQYGFGGGQSNFLGTINTNTAAMSLIGQTVDGIDAVAWVELSNTDLEQFSLDTADQILSLDLGFFNGPNNVANAGRQNSLANRALDAADLITAGDIDGAIDVLESLLQKIDGQTPPPDWMDDSPEKTALAGQVSLLILLSQQ